MPVTVTLVDGTIIALADRTTLDAALGDKQPFVTVTDTAGEQWTINAVNILTIREQNAK